MAMKVGVFYNSISNPGKFSNKVMLMDNFCLGVLNQGDEIVKYKDNNLPDQDLAAGFVLGYTLEDNFRKKIIDQLRARKIPVVFVDSNILHYARPEHEWHRYSLNSVYPNDGVYFFREPDPDKWHRFSEWHAASLKPWRQVGNHIVVFCQRPKGWNMFGNNQEIWLDNTIENIRKYTDRPIMVRMHPGDGTRFKAIEKLQKRYGQSISISEHANIQEALSKAWCTVGYNSTPNVVSTIEGIPGYIEDPIHSWAKDVAFTDMSQIIDPPLPDRTIWANKIANIHWSNQEVRSGQLWSAIKHYIAGTR
jgi:hypothetical protein